MDPGTSPTINYTAGTLGVGTPANTGGFTAGWNAGNTSYAIDFTDNATEEGISAQFTATSAVDANGNVQTSTGTSSSFVIDRQRPTISSINRTSPAGQFTNSSSVSYTVVFSEATSVVDNADFTATLVSTAAGTPSAGTIAAADVSTLNNITYTVIVRNVVGDGDIRLDVDASTAIINDAHGNALAPTSSHTGDE